KDDRDGGRHAKLGWPGEAAQLLKPIRKLLPNTPQVVAGTVVGQFDEGLSFHAVDLCRPQARTCHPCGAARQRLHGEVVGSKDRVDPLLQFQVIAVVANGDTTAWPWHQHLQPQYNEKQTGSKQKTEMKQI